jgi:uncharacterized membrane protein
VQLSPVSQKLQKLQISSEIGQFGQKLVKGGQNWPISVSSYTKLANPAD